MYTTLYNPFIKPTNEIKGYFIIWIHSHVGVPPHALPFGCTIWNRLIGSETLCVCTYVYLYIYIYIQTYIHIYIYTYAQLCVHLHVHISICVFASQFANTAVGFFCVCWLNRALFGSRAFRLGWMHPYSWNPGNHKLSNCLVELV